MYTHICVYIYIYLLQGEGVFQTFDKQVLSEEQGTHKCSSNLRKLSLIMESVSGIFQYIKYT